MSIFKESFPSYVFNQLKVREEILSETNSESIGRFGSPTISYMGSTRSGDAIKKEITLDNGAFFTNNGQGNSPFEVTDHMVELLNNQVTTTTGNTYQPAPNQSQFQDIGGATPSQYLDNLPS